MPAYIILSIFGCFLLVEALWFIRKKLMNNYKS